MENKGYAERVFPPANCFYQALVTHASEQLWSLLNTSVPGRMVNKIPFVLPEFSKFYIVQRDTHCFIDITYFYLLSFLAKVVSLHSHLSILKQLF